MIVNPTITPHILTDYDVISTTGVTLPITIDEDAGDHVDWSTSPLSVTFHLSERTSPTDPDAHFAAEDITVFLGHVLSITKRRRTVMPLTPDQKDEWSKVMHQLHKTVQ